MTGWRHRAAAGAWLVPGLSSSTRGSRATVYAPAAAGVTMIRSSGPATAEAPDWRIVLAPTSTPDLFTIAHGGNLSGENVIFRRLADGRVASVLLADSTWVRLDPVTT